jgi:ABC-type Na+ efflux pump permease subunit
MTSLLWKDFRINLPIILVALVCGVGPHIGLGTALLFENWPALPDASSWSRDLLSASHASFYCLIPLAGLLGANAIAIERSERTADFLFSLPPTRRQILISKAIVAGGVVLALWVANLLVTDLLGPWLTGSAAEFPGQLDYLAVTVMFFGTGWLGSSLMNSTTYAFGFPILALVAGGLIRRQVIVQADPRILEMVPAATQIATFSIGCVAFLYGSLIYLRRIEP